jgi:transcriptional regulator with XRE-family HTH domain
MSKYNHDIFFERAIELFGKTSQQELSKKIGISQAVISSIKTKSAKSPSADTIFLIANHFGVSVDWLLGLSDVKSTDKATKEQIYQEGYVAGYNDLKNKIQEFTNNI